LLFPAHSPDDPLNNSDPIDSQFLHFNYELCTALNMLKIGIVLDKMVDAGWMEPNMRRIFEAQADGLLGSLRAYNGMAHERQKRLAHPSPERTAP
jgi:hypothetical protein